MQIYNFYFFNFRLTVLAFSTESENCLRCRKINFLFSPILEGWLQTGFVYLFVYNVCLFVYNVCLFVCMLIYLFSIFNVGKSVSCFLRSWKDDSKQVMFNHLFVYYVCLCICLFECLLICLFWILTVRKSFSCFLQSWKNNS